MWDVLLDALIDSAKILPIILVVYFLIEFLEYNYGSKIKNSRFLKGKASPVMGALFGCVPQCGFSVITTDLFTKKAVSVGALIAVYLATSDEALPIMLAEPSHILDLLLLIGCKLVMGIGIGYLAMFLYSKLFTKPAPLTTPQINLQKEEAHNHEQLEKQEAHEPNEEKAEMMDSTGCCHHHMQTKKFEWIHPLVHCLKIFAYILIVNLILGMVIFFIGEENFMNFLKSSYVFQPILAVIIGLIPNCAASVLITELYLSGGLSFGSILAGLCVNSGLAMVLLLKQNKNWKENLFILLMLVVPSLLVGYALHFVHIF